MSFIIGTATPSAAADNSEPPALASIRMQTPRVLYEDERVRIQWAGTNISDGYISYQDSLGEDHSIRMTTWTGGIAQGLDIESRQTGPVTLTSITVMSPTGGRITYSPDGGIWKYPTGLKDPAPISIDFPSFNFVLEPLRQYPNPPQLTVAGSPAVGQMLTAQGTAPDLLDS